MGCGRERLGWVLALSDHSTLVPAPTRARASGTLCETIFSVSYPQRLWTEKTHVSPIRATFGSIPDIHERLLTATSGSSWIRRQWSNDVSLNDRYRLEAAIHLIEC